MPKNFGFAVPDLVAQPIKTLPADCQSPNEFHKLFLDKKFVDEMVRVSKLYIIKKGRVKVVQDLHHAAQNIFVDEGPSSTLGFIP